MSASSKEPHKNSDKQENTPETNSNPHTIKKIVSITRYRNEQMKALVKVGVAANHTDFFRLAIRNLIKENQQLLPNNLISANWKDRINESKSSKKKNKGN